MPADTTIFIVFCSPAGATRRVADVIKQTMKSTGFTLHFLDLAEIERHAAFLELVKNTHTNTCLFVGSPVYRDVAVPPVMQFINALAPVQHGYAIPFITWGGACSGIALWQMGQALSAKGYTLAAAAKILGQHSMMWQAQAPEGVGHPDGEDIQAVENLCKRLIEQLRVDKVQPLDLAILDYQTETEALHMKEKLNQSWMIIPKTVDENKCTRCGVCQEECPAAAITMDDLPQFLNTCFNCFNCIRLCPEEAIVSAVTIDDIHQQILARVTRYNEIRKPLIF